MFVKQIHELNFAWKKYDRIKRRSQKTSFILQNNLELIGQKRSALTVEITFVYKLTK